MRFHNNIFSVIKELNIVRKQKTYCHSAQFSIANIWGSKRRARFSKVEVTSYHSHPPFNSLPPTSLIDLLLAEADLQQGMRTLTLSALLQSHTDTDFLAAGAGTSYFSTLCLHLLVR